MATQERIETWQISVTCCGLAARALNATIAFYHSSGPDADTAWKSVEAARLALARSMSREAQHWKALGGKEDQQVLPGMDRSWSRPLVIKGRKEGKRGKKPGRVPGAGQHRTPPLAAVPPAEG